MTEDGTIPMTPLEAWIAAKIGVATLTREALGNHQLARLRDTVAWVRARSPFYRDRLARLPADPIRSLSDLATLPFTTPADLSASGLQFLCVSQGDIARVTTIPTSGTTGAPKRVFFTEEDLDLTADFFHHGMSTLVEPGWRVLVLMPGPSLGSVGDLLVKGLARLGVETVVYGFVDDPETVLDVIEARAVDTLVGVPVQVLRLARHPRAARLPTGRLKTALLSSDYLPGPLARAVEDAFGCRVFDHWGMTETALGGGVQCRALGGYHLREADLLVEIVDPASGRPLPEDEWGEVVVTTLTRDGMPLLRYRTGDLSRYLSDPCPCGTALASLDQVKGRVAAAVSLDGAHALSMPDLDEALFGLGSLLDFAAEVQTGDRLSVRLWACDGTDLALLEAARGALASLPAVGRSGVEVSVTMAEGPLPGPGKRKIGDRRGG